jgi:hypothetical protein
MSQAAVHETSATKKIVLDTLRKDTELKTKILYFTTAAWL